MLCCAFPYVHSSFAIILMWKRKLVALPGLSSWCLMIVLLLFHAVPWVCLRFVIMVFPVHTHLLILISKDVPPGILFISLAVLFTLQTSYYDEIIDFCVKSVSLATSIKKCNISMA